MVDKVFENSSRDFPRFLNALQGRVRAAMQKYSTHYHRYHPDGASSARLQAIVDCILDGSFAVRNNITILILEESAAELTSLSHLVWDALTPSVQFETLEFALHAEVIHRPGLVMYSLIQQYSQSMELTAQSHVDAAKVKFDVLIQKGLDPHDPSGWLAELV